MIQKIKKNQEQRIRGPKLVVLIENINNFPMEQVSMEQALARADMERRVIASNMRLDRVLNEWESVRHALPCWTGTMTGYVEPDRTFREAAERIASLGNSYFIIDIDLKNGKRYLFPVPDAHLDKKNAILISEHPDYSISTDGNDRIIQAAKVDLIERFPVSNGWYLQDPDHGIPVGENVDPSIENARALWRTDRRVGLIIRGSYGSCGFKNGDDIDTVGIYSGIYKAFPYMPGKGRYLGPSLTLGVLVEASDNSK